MNKNYYKVKLDFLKLVKISDEFDFLKNENLFEVMKKIQSSIDACLITNSLKALGEFSFEKKISILKFIYVKKYPKIMIVITIAKTIIKTKAI